MAYGVPNMAHTIAQSCQRGMGAAELFYAGRAAQSRRFWAALTRRPTALRTLAQAYPQG